jgi:hypothetical protein
MLEDLPDYWNMLDAQDQQGYRSLKRVVEQLSLRAPKKRSAINFHAIMGHVHAYVVQNNENDWKRSMVCGIAWLPGAIAVSTTRLRQLFGKCKGSLNGGLTSIGFKSSPMVQDAALNLARQIPLVKDAEARKWTLRVPSQGNCVWVPEMAIVCEDAELRAVGMDHSLEFDADPGDWDYPFGNGSDAELWSTDSELWSPDAV